jgi:hypothetical protein
MPPCLVTLSLCLCLSLSLSLSLSVYFAGKKATKVWGSCSDSFLQEIPNSRLGNILSD